VAASVNFESRQKMLKIGFFRPVVSVVRVGAAVFEIYFKCGHIKDKTLYIPAVCGYKMGIPVPSADFSV
jgi:hypothetical protein